MEHLAPDGGAKCSPLLTRQDARSVPSAGSGYLEFVVGKIDAPHALPVLNCETGPQRAVDALVVQIPTLAVAGGPHRVVEPGLDAPVEPLLHAGPDLDRLG